MTSHISLERLSSYLDAELSSAEVGAVERHLEECTACRDHLRGLRRVIGELQTLERAAPPSVLAQQVERRLALERPPRGLVERLEARLGRRSRVDSGLGLGFALVLALAAILYLFADALDRWEQGQVPIVVPGATAVDAEQSDGVREAGGRNFRLRGGVWVEDGAGEAARRIEPDDPAGRALRGELPWLDDLLAGSQGVVLLLDDGETVVVEGMESRTGTAGREIGGP